MDQVVDALRAAGCVFAEDEASLLRQAGTGPELDAMIARRVAGEPLETILGWVEFCGRRLSVAPGVFVPRRRTELLAELARAAASHTAVELCCGAAPIASMLAARRLFAVDIDPAAAVCAERNAPAAIVLVGDLYAPLPRELRGTTDLIAANAPYVPTDAIALMPPEARDHEPLHTLDGGTDGLDLHRRIVAEAPEWLCPGGTLLIETSELQADETAAAMRSAGLTARIECDVGRSATVAVGVR
ncbi:putative protein N(5)-glutamine methyltransferase [Tsukamurella sp. 8F]|uniref:putative protein N(5)-glutamine methyltransferase n=1 Tax=unclassified Tsukamurella TaxID=2633480 RepID=UPI0023BA2D70|nr:MULTISPECIES: putative protein N(5)-glutamine methyltransferase [unclassified Tsukamurella]MDF0531450.1 putative protein N(5)-glutamine methyltransferase [Tsukamurella sp. 8J]MDF0587487.1 putative protein N(5)-glutamine methyltransferase [Tsukamurella sp. 8F]